MAQLGEAVAVAVAAALTDECPFSHEAGKHDKQNDLANNPQKLGGNLGSGGEPVEITVTVRGHSKQMEVGFGAHHLIPGNASLRKSQKLLKLMKKGDLKGDVGYGLNHHKNGAWLPGNYRWDAGTYSKWSALGKTGGFEIQFAYAYYAMQATGCQFHDAHTDYNGWVRRTLEKIRKKMLELKSGCDKCDEVNSTKPWNPPYELVTILDGLSNRLRTHVTGPPALWYPPFCTSRMAVLVGAGYTPEKMAQL